MDEEDPEVLINKLYNQAVECFAYATTHPPRTFYKLNTDGKCIDKANKLMDSISYTFMLELTPELIDTRNLIFEKLKEVLKENNFHIATIEEKMSRLQEKINICKYPRQDSTCSTQRCLKCNKLIL